MKPRFFSDRKIEGDVVCLDGKEHEHMTRVLRLSEGDSVILFDGTGNEFHATLEEVRRQSTRLSVFARLTPDRELTFELTLGVALPKGDRQQWLIEKCVELGVSRVIPMITHRGVVHPRDNARNRLGRWVIAASKQCGRNRLMDIGDPEQVADFFARARSQPVLVAHPSESSGDACQVFNQLSRSNPCSVAVGPEGGFTDDEIRTAKATGCTLLSLGQRILRVDTATLAIVANLVLGRSAD